MNFLKGLWLRLMSLFGASRTQSSEKVSPASPSDNAVRKTSSTYEKLQSMPAEKPTNPVVEMNQDKGYQASRAGAAATSAASRPPRRASSTFTKLQSLSSTGTGVNSPTPIPADTPLNNLLERLDVDGEQQS